jgi:hypothetical protein
VSKLSGVPNDIIQLLGRWRSAAFEAYFIFTDDEIIELQSLMLRHHPTHPTNVSALSDARVTTSNLSANVTVSDISDASAPDGNLPADASGNSAARTNKTKPRPSKARPRRPRRTPK